ncbi:hypothetical protein CPB86DRAFT_878222 [Serendipita vermifera]|nr:hypothetical protein CPB86DRAFT_878222 [Serendipita vermifera]
MPTNPGKISRKRECSDDEEYLPPAERPTKKAKSLADAKEDKHMEVPSPLDPGILELEDGWKAIRAELTLTSKQGPPAHQHKNSDPLARQMYMQTLCDNSSHWLENAARLQVDIELSQLENRPVNADKDRLEAQLVMEDMEKAIMRGEQEIHCFSTKVVDKNGELLCAYFSNHVHDAEMMTVRSEEEYHCFIESTPTEKITRHGLEPHNLDYIAFWTQDYLGTVGVKPGKVDARHDLRHDNLRRFHQDHYHEDYFLFQSHRAPNVSKPIPSTSRHVMNLVSTVGLGSKSNLTGQY